MQFGKRDGLLDNQTLLGNSYHLHFSVDFLDLFVRTEHLLIYETALTRRHYKLVRLSDEPSNVRMWTNFEQLAGKLYNRYVRKRTITYLF